MSDETTAWDEIRQVAEEIGFDADMTHGEWGRLFADLLMVSASDEAMRVAVADFGSGYRSKHYSDQRGRLREVTRQVARGKFKGTAMVDPADGAIVPTSPVPMNGNAAEFVAMQLAYPITLPGEPPRKLAEVNFWLLDACGDAIEKKMRGFGQNLERVRRWAGIVKPWPDRSVSSLLHDGTISATELFPPDAPVAIAEGDDEAAD